MSEAIAFAELPGRIPVFPLAGVLLLPRGRLPLNIFEPRYLEMTRDAMAGHKLIGMIQPEDPLDPAHDPAIYAIGCAGRITRFEETGDGRYIIVLTGLARFRIARELERATGYRQVEADWRAFADDLAPPDEAGVDRARLLPPLKAYLRAAGIEIEAQVVDNAPSAVLVDQLAMICPFQPGEKQALLEAPDLPERARVMTALIEMALLGSEAAPAPGRVN
jgi:hypothetical protein